MKLKDFSLLKEEQNHYVVGHPKGRSIVVPKQGLNEKAHQLIQGLPKPHFFEGGVNDLSGLSDEDFKNQMDAPASAFNNNESQLDHPNAIEQVPSSNGEQAPPSSPELAQPENQVAVTNPLDTAQKDIESGVQAQEAAGKASSQAYADSAEGIKKEVKNFQDLYNEHLNKDKDLEAQVAGDKINPNRIWDNMSTGSKIGAAIALALGGLNSRENPALAMINNTIARDIDAQKMNQDSDLNLYKMNRENLRDDIQAHLMTLQQQLSVAKVMAMQAEAKAQGPVARANAAQLILGLEQQKDQIRTVQALRGYVAQPGVYLGEDPSPYVTAMIPKEHQAKAFEEVGKMQQAVQLKKGLVQSYNDLNNKILAGTLSFRDRESSVNAFAGPLAKLGEGRFNLQEAQNQMDALLPKSFESAETRKYKMERMNQFFKSLVATPVLNFKYLNPEKFKSTNLDSVNDSYQPGTILNIQRR